MVVTRAGDRGIGGKLFKGTKPGPGRKYPFNKNTYAISRQNHAKTKPFFAECMKCTDAAYILIINDRLLELKVTIEISQFQPFMEI